MSASQNSSPGLTPNGTAPQVQSTFRRRQADPLVRRKKPGALRPAPRTSAPSGVNGLPKQNGPNKTTPPSLSHPTLQQNQAPLEEYEDFPLYTTKRALLEGVRHHVMRLLPNNSFENRAIDPSDESEFVRPVRLHRRDPRASSSVQWRENTPVSSDGDSKANVVDDKERERLEATRAEKRAERDANQAQIAPTAKKEAEIKKKNKLQKKTELVYKFSDSVTKEKNQKIRYEEALPWHLEDFDNKNIWAGTYEAALSECHVMLVRDPSGTSFQMVPVEKWYKFTPKQHFKTLTIEEAEARMGKRVRDPRWFMETQKELESQKEKNQRQGRGALFTRQGERGERAKSGMDGEYEKPEETADMDDIDYDYEEAFADDEENALFEGDKEESKQAEEKLMRERREANIFELKEEKDYDEEEEEGKRRAEEEKKLGKKIEKALMKRERNFVYEDDSDRNPYASESDSGDSDEESSSEKGVANDPDGAELSDKTKTAANEAVPSGASSKGTSTSSGRGKNGDSKRTQLKRPGSPNLSEASGNESSRKKAKKSHSTSQPSNSALAGPSISRPSSPGNQALAAGSSISRPLSPANQALGGPSISRPSSPATLNGDVRPNSIIKLRGGTGAGSGSEGEVSDGTKLKLKKKPPKSATNSRVVSPNESRASSPTAGAAQAKAQSTSKVLSKNKTSSSPSPSVQLPSLEEIRSKIPPEGIELSVVMDIFGQKVMKSPGFLGLLKSQVRWAKGEQKLYPKGS